MNAQQKAIQSLWKGSCTVRVRVSTVDPNTGRNVWTDQIVAQDVPCRLSYSRVEPTTAVSGGARVMQDIKLFVDPAVPTPAGSKIEVTQNGVTNTYVSSGEPAVHSYHKEIALEVESYWA